VHAEVVRVAARATHATRNADPVFVSRARSIQATTDPAVASRVHFVASEERNMRRVRARRRGVTTVETMWIVIAFSVPFVALMSVWGLEQLSSYRAARNYSLQSFP
jgi:hypothetical protein